MIFIGGGMGSLCRYLIGLALEPLAQRFPLATLCANVLSAMLLGAVLALTAQNAISNQTKLFLATGFCGGFSTFSTFTAETAAMAQEGLWIPAVANIFLNLFFCLLSFGMVRQLLL